MLPDRLEAAAVHCLLLADALEKDAATDSLRALAADLLCWIPLPHPMRCIALPAQTDPEGRIVYPSVDMVLRMARAVQTAKVERSYPEDPGPLATAEGLRSFVADLRGGAAVMAQTGWCRTLGGGR